MTPKQFQKDMEFRANLAIALTIFCVLGLIAIAVLT